MLDILLTISLGARRGRLRDQEKEGRSGKYRETAIMFTNNDLPLIKFNRYNSCIHRDNYIVVERYTYYSLPLQNNCCNNIRGNFYGPHTSYACSDELVPITCVNSVVFICRRRDY